GGVALPAEVCAGVQPDRAGGVATAGGDHAASCRPRPPPLGRAGARLSHGAKVVPCRRRPVSPAADGLIHFPYCRDLFRVLNTSIRTLIPFRVFRTSFRRSSNRKSGRE